MIVKQCNDLNKSLQQDESNRFEIIPYITLSATILAKILLSNKIEIPYSTQMKKYSYKIENFCSMNCPPYHEYSPDAFLLFLIEESPTIY